MFKELIASAILSFSVGTSVPQTEKASNITYGTQIFGNYWVTPYESYSNDYDFESLIGKSYTWEYEHGDNQVFCYYDVYTRYCPVDSIHIDVEQDSQSVYIIHCDISMTDGDFTINFRYYWDDFYGYEECESDWRNIVFYFTTYNYFERDAYDLFSALFTNTIINDSVELYTGWYTFSNTINMSGNYYLYGNLTANNNLYNEINMGAIGIDFNYVGGSFVSNPFRLYDRGTWYGSKSIYMTAFVIPVTYKPFFTSNGTFDYVPVVEQSDFQDLFYSIADTPVKLLTDMFDFTLLGVNLGIALISILTLLIIVVVIKKIV